MARCNHDHISLTIQSTRLIVATVADTGATHVARNAPDLAPLRIAVNCLACGYSNVLTTYYGTDTAWKRWPQWTLRRLEYLRNGVPDLDEAMTAVGIINLGYGLPLYDQAADSDA